MPEFSLTSNSGREQTTFRLDDCDLDRPSCTLSVHSSAQFWDARADIGGAGLVPERTVEFHQVGTDWQRLGGLNASLREWLRSAMPFGAVLANNDRSKLGVQIGVSADLISSADKPVFSLTYEVGTMVRLSWRYVVDQSCIRVFSDELGTVLSLRR